MLAIGGVATTILFGMTIVPVFGHRYRLTFCRWDKLLFVTRLLR
ncbi:MAG: hypothetical protein P8I83_09750 [Paracoccaceae bacterium]|nr:hypothetical protein [Paracoccaceae bacterium]